MGIIYKIKLNKAVLLENLGNYRGREKKREREKERTNAHLLSGSTSLGSGNASVPNLNDCSPVASATSPSGASVISGSGSLVPGGSGFSPLCASRNSGVLLAGSGSDASSTT